MLQWMDMKPSLSLQIHCEIAAFLAIFYQYGTRVSKKLLEQCLEKERRHKIMNVALCYVVFTFWRILPGTLFTGQMLLSGSLRSSTLSA